MRIDEDLFVTQRRRLAYRALAGLGVSSRMLAEWRGPRRPELERMAQDGETIWWRRYRSGRAGVSARDLLDLVEALEHAEREALEARARRRGPGRKA